MSSDGELLPSLANRSTVLSTCEIGDLADEDLAAIFKRLPLHDRLRASEVCARWHALSRKPWLDVVHLDLSPICHDHIVAVIKQCSSNLRTVYAQRKTFSFNRLHILSKVPLESVSLRECTAYIPGSRSVVTGTFTTLFSNELESASWQELTLSGIELAFDFHNIHLLVQKVVFPAVFPAGVKRLQLSDVQFRGIFRGCRIIYAPHLDPRIGFQDYILFDRLERYQQLECLIMQVTKPVKDFCASPILAAFSSPEIYDRIGALGNLRELSLGSCDSIEARTSSLTPIFKLPRLEVLFLRQMPIIAEEMDEEEFEAVIEAFKQLISGSSLRILVLTEGIDVEIELPARRRYPNGLGSPAASLLHIFMDQSVSEMISLPITGTEAAKTYLITERLDVFLDREDIAPIFEGVWIAEQIRKSVAEHVDDT